MPARRESEQKPRRASPPAMISSAEGGARPMKPHRPRNLRAQRKPNPTPSAWAPRPKCPPRRPTPRAKGPQIGQSSRYRTRRRRKEPRALAPPANGAVRPVHSLRAAHPDRVNRPSAEIPRGTVAAPAQARHPQAATQMAGSAKAQDQGRAWAQEKARATPPCAPSQGATSRRQPAYRASPSQHPQAGPRRLPYTQRKS